MFNSFNIRSNLFNGTDISNLNSIHIKNIYNQWHKYIYIILQWIILKQQI